MTEFYLKSSWFSYSVSPSGVINLALPPKSHNDWYSEYGKDFPRFSGSDVISTTSLTETRCLLAVISLDLLFCGLSSHLSLRPKSTLKMNPSSSALELLGAYGSDSDQGDVDVLTISHHCSPVSPSDNEESRVLLSDASPSAKKCLQFSPAVPETLAGLAVAASAALEEEDADDVPLANLRQKARSRWASKRPMESEIDSTLVSNVSDQVQSHSVEEVSVTVTESIPNLGRVATRRFTRSQSTKALLEKCPLKKQKKAGSHPDPVDSVPETEKEISGNISETLPRHDSDPMCPGPMFFKSNVHMGLWESVTGRTFIREHSLSSDKPNHQSIITFLHEVGLERIVLNVQSFVKQTVLEFYCNLSPDIRTTGTTFVRGMNIKFSPAVINSFIGFTLSLG